MKKLEVDSLLSIGMPTIDKQHGELYTIYNDLCKCVEEKASKEILYTALVKLVTHSEHHFQTEEHFMEINGYPHGPQHKKIHKALLTEIGAITISCGDNALLVSERVVDYIHGWLVEHIKTEDARFGIWLKAEGVI